MEKYFIFGIISAVIVVSVVFLLFGVGKQNMIPTNPINSSSFGYSVANSSLQRTILNDIVGFNPYQNNIRNGKEFTYNINSSTSTSLVLNGSTSNSTAVSNGEISLMKSLNGNSETQSNLTIYSEGLTLNSSSTVFSVGNNTYMCLISTLTGGNKNCIPLNLSFDNLSNTLLTGLKINKISVLRDYNTTYLGYKCLFTEASFSIDLNESNSSFSLNNVGFTSTGVLSGTETSCLSSEYNMPVMNSIFARISLNQKIKNTSLVSNSYIDYNMSIKKIENFNGEITLNSLS